MNLYKYKRLKETVDLKRLLEVLEDKKIYLPRFFELNDPFESFVQKINLSVCGEGILSSVGVRSQIIDNLYEEYGILSLTSDCKNQVMWAMYGSGYQGVCICFDFPNNTRKVEYLTKKTIKKIPEIDVDEILKNKDLLEDSLFKKDSLWSYEKEYRIISNGKFLKFKKKNLKYLIIGHKVEGKIRDVLIEKCNKIGIDVYKTYIHYVDNDIYIKKMDFEPTYDGSDISDDI